MKFALRQVKYAVAYEVRIAHEVCFAHGGKFYFMSEGHFIVKQLHIAQQYFILINLSLHIRNDSCHVFRYMV